MVAVREFYCAILADRYYNSGDIYLASDDFYACRYN